jgi:hypothetical protein
VQKRRLAADSHHPIPTAGVGEGIVHGRRKCPEWSRGRVPDVLTRLGVMPTDGAARSWRCVRSVGQVWWCGSSVRVSRIAQSDRSGIPGISRVNVVGETPDRKRRSGRLVVWFNRPVVRRIVGTVAGRSALGAPDRCASFHGHGNSHAACGRLRLSRRLAAACAGFGSGVPALRSNGFRSHLAARHRDGCFR